MPTQQIHTVEMLHGKSLQEQVEYLTNEVAKLQKILRYLLNGQLDFENIRAAGIKTENLEAGSVTADKMNVYGLTVSDGEKVTFQVSPTGEITVDGNIHMGEGSSISWDYVNSDPATSQAQQSADMARKVAEDIADGKYDGGTFIDGTTVAAPNIVGGVITGGIIRTSPVYPRVVLDPQDNNIAFEFSATRKIIISADTQGRPILSISNANNVGFIENNDHLTISSTVPSDITISAGGELNLQTNSNRIRVSNWNTLYSNVRNETLQTALNDKIDKDDGVTNVFTLLDENGDPITFSFINGQLQYVS